MLENKIKNLRLLGMKKKLDTSETRDMIQDLLELCLLAVIDEA